MLDAADAAREYVDIALVSVDNASQPHWRLMLSADPPGTTAPDGPETVISYGLAFETTGDGAPDYIVGISDETSRPGDYYIWVTDLATGRTVEQDGPPYGFPIEFSHPGERQPGDPGGVRMLFTFLGGSRPPGVTLSTPFYAWASVEEDGEVVAWDYAPDDGWIKAPRELEAPEVVLPTPMPNPAPGGVRAQVPPDMPECQAELYDFAGEGTLRGLGLDTATPVTPPDIDRVGMIWVTHDFMPYDAGPPGGPIQMTRMLCFSFPDGSGGSEWPVDPAWEPPSDAGG